MYVSISSSLQVSNNLEIVSLSKYASGDLTTLFSDFSCTGFAPLSSSTGCACSFEDSSISSVLFGLEISYLTYSSNRPKFLLQ